MAGPEWVIPDFPWTLSAPESAALRDGPATIGGWCIKLAFLELVVRGHLRLAIQPRRKILRWERRPELVVLKGEPGWERMASPLFAVMAAFDSVTVPETQYVRGAPVVKVTKAILESWSDVDGYVMKAIIPSLGRGGYYRTEDYRRLRIIQRTRWVPTAAADAAHHQLESWVGASSIAIGHRIAMDPGGAAEFVSAVGPAILLCRPILDHLPHLARLVPDPAGYLAALSADLGPGPADKIADAYDAIDAAVDRGIADYQNTGY